MQPGLDDIRNSALWHLHDIDFADRRFVLRKISEAHYRQASFLDQRIETLCPEAYAYNLDHIGQIFEGQHEHAPLHFIFHMGHCGSTLLSRGLSITPTVLPVREPLTLRALANAKRDKVPANTEPALRATLDGLGRTFGSGQATIVKATSTCNNLIKDILEASPESHAVLMYVRLEVLLAGMLGKQQPALDITGHLPIRLADWETMTGDSALRADDLDEGKRVALAWITGMNWLSQSQAAFPGRCQLLDFETFLEAPGNQLQSQAQFLGLPFDREQINQAWPAVASGYSKKPDHPYTAEHRRITLERGRLQRGEEIRTAMNWAARLINSHPNLSTLESLF